MSETILNEKRTRQLAATADRWYAQTIKGKDKQFYHRLVAGNGQIIMVSEGYTRANDCKDSALVIAARMGIPLHLSHNGKGIDPREAVIIMPDTADTTDDTTDDTTGDTPIF